MSESAGRHLVFFGRHFFVRVRQNGAEAPLLAALIVFSQFHEIFQECLWVQVWKWESIFGFPHCESKVRKEISVDYNSISWLKFSPNVHFCSISRKKYFTKFYLALNSIADIWLVDLRSKTLSWWSIFRQKISQTSVILPKNANLSLRGLPVCWLENDGEWQFFGVF